MHLSDILIMFKSVLDEEQAFRARACLMETGRSVLVHQKDGQGRLFLVKFDPRDVTPDTLLGAVRHAGFEASMAGG